ncbi:MAG: putative small integral membrane protein [Paracoccaceae bacterium]|jgi:predicted small integral membrane protein
MSIHAASNRVSLGLAIAGVILGGVLYAGVDPETWGIDLTRNIAPGIWMAWTWAGAIFFIVIGSCLIAMTIWQIRYPEPPRHGVLGIETTPGDRLFLSLLGSAFICLAWLAFFGAPLWGALACCLIWAAGVFRLV